MRFRLALIYGAVLLAVGCNSKPSRPEATDESAPAGASVKSQPVFRNRAASVAAPLEDAKTGANAPAASRSRTPFPPSASPNPAVARPEPAPGTDEPTPTEQVAQNVRPEDLPQEGDQVLIPPKMLGKLIPGSNFDAVEREEPINVNPLLEQRGIVFTNYQQLVEMGITNYQIVRTQQGQKSNK